MDCGGSFAGGSAWRLMPHDLPPWAAVYQQSQRWFVAVRIWGNCGWFASAVAAGSGTDRKREAVIFDSRTLQSTPESGERAGYDGGKRKKGSKVHIAVDTSLFCHLNKSKISSQTFYLTARAWLMPLPAVTTVSFIDDYCNHYQDLFGDVRNFEAFKFLVLGMICRNAT